MSAIKVLYDAIEFHLDRAIRELDKGMLTLCFSSLWCAQYLILIAERELEKMNA